MGGGRVASSRNSRGFTLVCMEHMAVAKGGRAGGAGSGRLGGEIGERKWWKLKGPLG